MLCRPPISALFPYTTLFRSCRTGADRPTSNSGTPPPPPTAAMPPPGPPSRLSAADRKSTRLNSSHVANSYAVFCLKKKTMEDTKEKEEMFGIGLVVEKIGRY